jgi:hypothetical protein
LLAVDALVFAGLWAGLPVMVMPTWMTALACPASAGAPASRRMMMDAERHMARSLARESGRPDLRRRRREMERLRGHSSRECR